MLFIDGIIYMAFDKFVFKAFNYLIYNQKINNLLVASYLLKLPNYYTLLNNIKFLNLVIF